MFSLRAALHSARRYIPALSRPTPALGTAATPPPRLLSMAEAKPPPPPTVDFTTVDAFSDKAFGGNPAAVVLLKDGYPDDEWMRLVAREMNLSETAFLAPVAGAGGAVYNLRWFTPTVEVDLCGHATLAAAHHLIAGGFVDPAQPIEFRSLRSGSLFARQAGGEGIQLEFPPAPVEELPAGDARRGILSKALGVDGSWVGHSPALDDLVVELPSESAVRGLTPDLTELSRAGGRGVIATALATDTPGYDFVSRFFGPCAGIDEDPVTGSAHCALGPYWMGKLGKSEMRGYQCSGRGGSVKVVVRGGEPGGIELVGPAVTVLRGQMETGSWSKA